MNGIVYLDHNATTPVAREARAEMADALENVWANPSSTHGPGQAARRTLADARARVAGFLGCSSAELAFTSGATEANHMAVLGALQAAVGTARRRLVLSAVEHPGLLALARRLQAQGTPVDLIGVDAQGRLDLGAAARLIGPDVALVCVMGANNETGVLMPVAEVAALAHDHGCLLHVDATQLAGKHPLDFASSGADLMAVSAHKLGGPKGVGALVLRKGVTLPPLISGRQERQRRGGTENLPGSVGFAAACDRAGSALAEDLDRLGTLRRRLEAGLLQALPGTHLYGEQAPRLCNTACLRFGELPAEAVLARLERAGVVAASGAACTASGTQPSHVLLAMGATPAQARAGVRFSLGRDSTAEDVERALAVAVRVVQSLLAQAPAAVDPARASHQEPA